MDGVVEGEAGMAIVVEIVDGGDAQIASAVGVDDGTAEDEVHVEILNVLPKDACGEVFATLEFVAHGRCETGGEQPSARRYPVVGIAEGDAPLSIVDAVDAEGIVDGGGGREGAEELFGAFGIEGHALAVVADARQPRACAAELHGAHGEGCGIGEVTIVEDVVEIEREGVGAHGGKAL